MCCRRFAGSVSLEHRNDVTYTHGHAKKRGIKRGHSAMSPALYVISRLNGRDWTKCRPVKRAPRLNVRGSAISNEASTEKLPGRLNPH